MIKTSKSFSKYFLITFLLSLLVVGSSNLIQTVIPLYMSINLGSTLSEIGLIISISSTSAIILRPFLGFLVDRIDRRCLLLISLSAIGLIYLAYIFVKTPTSFGILRFIQGIPLTIATTTFSAIASDLIQDDRMGEGLSYFTLTNTLAIAIGPSVGIALLNNGWNGLPFLVSSIIVFLCCIASLQIKVTNKKRKTGAFSLNQISNLKIGWLIFTGSLVYFGIPGIMTYSTLYSKAMGISNISLAYTIYGVGLVCTRLLAAKLIDKHGATKVGTISITILMIGFTLIGVYPTRYGLFIGSLILSVGCGMITPTLLTMAVNVVGSNRRGSAIAMIFTSFDIGMGLGSWLFGRVADIFGNFNIAYLLCAVVEIAAVGIFWHLAIPNYKLNKVPENT